MTSSEIDAYSGELGKVQLETERIQRLSSLGNGELLNLWAEIMVELRNREIIRSSNNPTADYAEHLVSTRLNLVLVGNSTAGYDAKSTEGSRYQIKGRRLTPENPSRQLSAIRKLETDSFDFLVAVIFGKNFELLEMWQFPIELVREHAKYRKHVNAHILHAQGAILRDHRASLLSPSMHRTPDVGAN